MSENPYRDANGAPFAPIIRMGTPTDRTSAAAFAIIHAAHRPQPPRPGPEMPPGLVGIVLLDGGGR